MVDSFSRCPRIPARPQCACPRCRAAIARSYRANAEYDEANRKGTGNLKTLAGLLYKAMKTEDAAIDAMREHIAEHDGCKL